MQTESYDVMATDELPCTPEPSLAAFLVGNSTGFVPKPWAKAKLKEALVDTLNEFGDDPWIICEPLYKTAELSNKPAEKRVLTVTKLAIGATEEYKMLNPSTETKSGSKSKSSKGNKENAKVPKVLSSKAKYPDFLQMELNKLNEESIYGNMLSLEERISKKKVTLPKLSEKSPVKISPMGTPTIVMVIEGDLDTVKHVADAVKKNIPVVLVRGSGMAADLIGYCLEEDSLYQNDPDHTLKIHVPMLFGKRIDEKDESLKEAIKVIWNNRSKVSEFDLHTDSANTLKHKIAEVIIRVWAISEVKGGSWTTENQPDKSKASETSGDGSLKATEIKENQLKLAKLANNNDVLSQSDSTQSDSTKQRWWVCCGGSVSPEPTTDQVQQQIKECKHSPIAIHHMLQEACSGENMGEFGKELLLYALKKNRCDIIEYLVDRGVEPNFSQIKVLYKELDDERTEKQKTRSSIADMIKLPERTERKNFPENRATAWELGCDIIPYTIIENETKKDVKRMSSDLLLWAVLSNKMEIAEVFWKRSPEPILTALIASALLRKMSRKAHHRKEDNLENAMLKHSRVFRQRAIDVTQRLFENNEEEALFAMEVENSTTVWGVKENCLEFALEHEIYEFVSHHVPQRSFDRIMYGKDFFHFKQLNKPEENRGCCPGVKKKHFRVPFFIASPFLMFIIHYIIFCLFLVCLSAFIMTNIREKKWPIDEKSVYEYCAYLWLFADIIEEYLPPAFYALRQKCVPGQWERRVWNHLHNVWNKMDFVSYAVMIIAIGFRFAYETTDFVISRRFYSIGLYLMYMRFLHVLLFVRSTGTAVIMMLEGLKELGRFVAIMAVLVLSTGVFYHANLYPNHYDMFSPLGVKHWSVWKIITYPYWSIYGEFKKEIEGTDSTETCSKNETIYMNDPNIERCPEQDLMVQLFSGFFVLILNLLLVNLIIAMFSFRFEEIKNDSDQFWRFHRSQVIMEFRRRFPVPLNLVLWPIYILYSLINFKDDNKQKKEDKDGRKTLDEKQQILARRWISSENDTSLMHEGSRTNRK